MTDKTTTDYADLIAGRLEAWTAELDRADPVQVYGILSAAAFQIAKRRGPAHAATELRELALVLEPKGTRQ